MWISNVANICTCFVSLFTVNRLIYCFTLQLWQNFFQLAVAFTCQPSLQLEVISEVKRNRIMDNYGDMRIAMNSLMINKWMALGSYQSRYVPGMIGPFLKVSLLPHTSKICSCY